MAVPAAINVAELTLVGKRLPSASLRRAGHLEHPNFFHKFDHYIFLLFFVLFVKKMARYTPSLESPALFISYPLSSCSSRSSRSRSRSRSTTAAAAGAIYSSSSWGNIQQQQQHTAAERHISRSGEQGADRGVSCAEMGRRFSRLVCRVGRKYNEQYNNHIQ